MRVMVVGGTRFIGRFAVEAILDRGGDVMLVHRGETEPIGMPEVRHLHGDRAHLDALVAEIAAFEPDVVLDMIPMTAADARTVVTVLGRHAGRFVAISSQDVYRAYDVLRGRDPGPLQMTPITEDAELRRNRFPYRDVFPADHPLHAYDKIPVEQVYLASLHRSGTVLRLPAVYGPHDAQHRTAPYLQRMRDGREVVVLAESLASWRWTRGYVEDVAAAIALAVTDDRASGQVYNIGSPLAMTEAEWVRAIARAAEWDGEVRVVADTDLPAGMQPEIDARQDLVVDDSKIRHQLGFTEVVPPEMAMARTIAWEAAQPHDPIDYTAEDPLVRK